MVWSTVGFRDSPWLGQCTGDICVHCRTRDETVGLPSPWPAAVLRVLLMTCYLWVTCGLVLCMYGEWLTDLSILLRHSTADFLAAMQCAFSSTLCSETLTGGGVFFFLLLKKQKMAQLGFCLSGQLAHLSTAVVYSFCRNPDVFPKLRLVFWHP